MLEQEVLNKLDKPLDPKRVKHRAGGGGMQLAYLKGHDVIDQANSIFGYGQWGYETIGVELQNIHAEKGDIIGGYYAARVKLTVTGCVPITEEGVCPIQEGRNPRAKIDAHDMARKGAITDALKRALRCFGDQFGNSLYDTDLVDGQPREANRQNSNAQTTSQPHASVNKTSPAPRPIQINSQKSNNGPSAGASPLTEMQRAAILKMVNQRSVRRVDLEMQLNEIYGCGLDGLTQDKAGDFINKLQGKSA